MGVGVGVMGARVRQTEGNAQQTDKGWYMAAS